MAISARGDVVPGATDAVALVARFVEAGAGNRPGHVIAAITWNSGMFLFRARTLSGRAEKVRPDIHGRL